MAENIIKCECGEEWVFYREYGSTSACECGRFYNPFGQQVGGYLEDIDPSYAGEVWDY